MGVEIELLGRFAVRREGGEVEAAQFGGRRVRQLVRILAVERGRVVTRDALIEALWGEQLPADPPTNLNVVVNRARRALGDTDLIQTAGGGYLLRSGPGVVVDVEQFEAQVERARDALACGDVAAARADAHSALGVWGEPLPEDAYADWVRGHRDRLERLHQEALEVATAAALAAGAARDAVNLAAEAVARQPLREAAHLLLVRAFAADGDNAAALAAYSDLRRVLAEELGIDPSAEAAHLHEQLLRGTVPVRASRPPVRPRADATPLVGRERELDELRGLGSENRIGVVAGRSGWGKSRLLEELCAVVDRRVLSARALLPERDEPWSLARTLLQTALSTGVDVRRLVGAATLASLADVLPDLDAPEPPLDPQTRRALTQQGAVRVLGATAPSLVVVDDLQWADSSSLDVLALLAGRSVDVTMVCAYRPEEVGEESPVARFLSVLAEARPVEVQLGPLGATAIGRLVASDPVVSALAEHTDGSPFAVLQAVRTLEREGMLRRGASGGWRVVGEPAPDRVREVAHAGQRQAVWRQFERQPRDARELLALLALLGRPAPVRLLATALSSTTQDALPVLRDLARNRLVRHVAAGFRVAHDLVAETVRDRLDPAERARLHQLLASALEESGSPVDEVARHLAGAGDAGAAASAYAKAATERLDRFAHREAEQLAIEGLQLDPLGEARSALLEVRAETYARRGDLRGARDDLRAALAGMVSRPGRSRLLTRLAVLTSGAEDLLRAAELASLALAEAGDDAGARARALHVAAVVDMNLEHGPRSEARFAEALSLFTSIGDAAGVADILDAGAMTLFGNGDISGGVAAFDRVAKLFADNGNLLRVVTPRSTRGHGLVFAARPQEALAETESALELARGLGYAEGEAMVLWHHAEALVACGRCAEGLAAAEMGLSIAQRIGHRGNTAVTLRALGIARSALGDLEGAADAFRGSLQSSENLSMLACWARSRLALTLLAQECIDEAAEHVRDALAAGPELAQYEARLAHCELAVKRGDDDAQAVVAQALQRALAGGHQVSAVRLQELIDRMPT